ncbi:MAG TPA: HAD family hydrolase [Gammaproteobacteria bacterium]|jgi:HAD superfamily hydrolase (TIGR01490 family)|nr:HAD family hydrolase [Gammaproteobacteria bacterium]
MTPVKLALFDLDHTLLDGDSDSLWGRFLVREGVVDGVEYAAANARYHAEYVAGRLDVHEFLAFGLRPLRDNPPEALKAWRARFVQEAILPRIPEGSRTLLKRHGSHTCVIITATNSFITAPIAAELGVPHLIATEPEQVEGRFTGRVAGVPCFREGKVAKLEEWLERNQLATGETWFYSDSHNDLPLLERVTHPTAVNPDEVLARVARERNWPTLQLHKEAAPADARRESA